MNISISVLVLMIKEYILKKNTHIPGSSRKVLKKALTSWIIFIPIGITGLMVITNII